MEETIRTGSGEKCMVNGEGVENYFETDEWSKELKTADIKGDMVLGTHVLYWIITTCVGLVGRPRFHFWLRGKLFASAGTSTNCNPINIPIACLQPLFFRNMRHVQVESIICSLLTVFGDAFWNSQMFLRAYYFCVSPSCIVLFFIVFVVRVHFSFFLRAIKCMSFFYRWLSSKKQNWICLFN